MTTACEQTENQATRETPSARASDPQPDTREGQVGPTGVADRLVVATKPGNSGGAKGPEFKTDVRKSTRARRLA
jgi:hypothetical protein